MSSESREGRRQKAEGKELFRIPFVQPSLRCSPHLPTLPTLPPLKPVPFLL